MGSEHINALGIGAVIEEYRVERLLGHGGFGMTYLARDLHLNTLVAIKEYLPQEFAVRAANSSIMPKSPNDEQGYVWGLERFKQEARALARFKHPHIVRASRLIEANGTAYMVMDYEHGLTLGEYIKKHGPTLAEKHILGVFLPILDGIHALHKAELVHRDIKPGNIYIRAEGGPMLIDFGAVRHAIGAHSRSLTAVVTPGYAPIEQYSSEGKQGPWTDLYAVGATMYTCILGRSPVDAARRSAAISDGDADPLVAAARVGQGKYSEQLLAAIDWALQFRTRDRPQSAVEFREALRRSPATPELLEFEEQDGDKTAMGAVPQEAWAAPVSAPRSGPQPHPATQVAPRPAGAVPSGDADVASAPMEWFDPPPDSQPRAANPPAAPRGQPTRDPDDDPLSRSNAGLIAAAAAAAGDRTPSRPTAKVAPAAAPAARKPAPTPNAPKAGAPRAGAKPGGLIANASARATPPARRGWGGPLAAALLLLGAVGGGAWWYASGAAERRDAKLWAAASRTGSVAGFEAYLDGCEACAKKADADAAIVELRRAAEAEAASDAQLERIAELKTRFAQHLVAGQIDAPAGDNARTVLDELGRLAPDDVFVISGRERLALLERERAAPVAGAPTTAASAPPPAIAPVQAAAPVEAAGAGKAPATEPQPVATKPTESAPAKKPVKPKPRKAAAEPVDDSTRLFELLAKFETALSKKDIDGGPQSAAVALREIEALAPGDAMASDARRRYEATKAKLEAQRQAAPAAAPATAATGGAPSATAAPAVGSTVRDALGAAGQGPALVMVAGGVTRLGDLVGGGNPDEQPVGSQRLRPFAIGKREVTVAQFRAFVEATQYVTDAERGGGCRVLKDGARARDPQASWRAPPFAQGDEHPVVCVSAADAGAYAAWLAQVTGARYRLPTEAEWEHAARAGSESAWWWGATAAADKANCRDCGPRAQPRTVESGAFDRNPWGLHDTAGNAWEWTCSAYEPSLGAAVAQCVNLRSENQIVMRGGSWATGADQARSSARGFAAMSWAADDVGFRVAKEY